MTQSTLANIFTGMTGGPEAIMADFKAIQGDLTNGAAVTADTGWTSSGITPVNGFSASSYPPLMYRVISFGKLSITFVQGSFSGGTDTAQWTTIQFCKVPTSSMFPNGFSYGNDGYQEFTTMTSDSHGMVQVRLHRDSFEIRPISSAYTAKNNGFDVNAVMISA